MSYSKTDKEIDRFIQNKPTQSVPMSIFKIIVTLGYLLLFIIGIATQEFILLIFALIIYGVMYMNLKKDDDNEKYHSSKLKHLYDLLDEQKKILHKWLWKFKPDGLDMIEYEERVQIEDLIEEYDRKSNDYDNLENHLNTISQEYPQKIKVLIDEITHFGDTIDENDEEYISRMKKIKSLKKEIKQTELNLKNLDKKRQNTAKKIISLVGNN